MKKAIFSDPYVEENDDGNMLVEDVFTMLNIWSIEAQINSNESNNMLIDNLFISQPEKSTTKEEEHIEIDELIMTKLND